MVGSDRFLLASALLCHEDADACLSDGEADGDLSCSLFQGDDDSCITAVENCPYEDAGDDEDDYYINVLINRETTFGGGCSRVVPADAADGSWLRNSRADAVRWILRTHVLFGFEPETAYLAVNFLDRFLVKRTIESRHNWAVQLLSMACVSVAAKLEECRVPALSEFRFGEYRFDGKAIRRMELLVLATLEWRLRAVTPFPYLSYLVSRTKRDRSHQSLSRGSIMARATSFLFAAMESMNTVDFRPSVIATAAFFLASGQQASTTTLKVSELECEAGLVASFSGSLQKEQVMSCYNLILESWNRKLMLDKDRSPTDAAPVDNAAAESDDLDNTSADLSTNSIINSKRRRLALKGYCSCHCYCSTPTGSNRKKSGPPSLHLD